MFRTADAFGIDKLWLVGYTAAPPKPQIDKVSLGAEKWIPFEKIEQTDLATTIQKLKEGGFEIVALEKTEKSTDIGQVSFNKKGADILKLADKIVHIPMLGKKESLNVSVAAGIAMYCIRGNIS